MVLECWATAMSVALIIFFVTVIYLVAAVVFMLVLAIGRAIFGVLDNHEARKNARRE